MDRKVNEQVKVLIGEILGSEAYVDYQNCAAKLEREPDTFRRVMEMRRAAFDVYGSSGGDLLEKSQHLTDSYKDVLEDPVAVRFLETEEEIVRMLREIEEAVISSVEIRNPLE